jgi:hypothetical protein
VLTSAGIGRGRDVSGRHFELAAEVGDRPLLGRLWQWSGGVFERGQEGFDGGEGLVADIARKGQQDGSVRADHLQAPDHVGVRGHMADVVGHLPDGPGDVVRAGVEDLRVVLPDLSGYAGTVAAAISTCRKPTAPHRQL